MKNFAESMEAARRSASAHDLEPFADNQAEILAETQGANTTPKTNAV